MTCSIKRTLVRFAALLAELERSTRPPRLGHDIDQPIDGAEQLAEHEAEQDVSEPALTTHAERFRAAIADFAARTAMPVNLLPAYAFKDCEQCGAICDGEGDCRWCAAAYSCPCGATCDEQGTCQRPIPFRDWVEPAIWTALTDHEPRITPSESGAGVLCCHYVFDDWQEWREHVSGPIAARIEMALLGTDFNRSSS